MDAVEVSSTRICLLKDKTPEEQFMFALGTTIPDQMIEISKTIKALDGIPCPRTLHIDFNPLDYLGGGYVQITVMCFISKNELHNIKQEQD